MKYRFDLAIVLLAAMPIWAHHGSAGFDQKKPVHLVGKVRHLEWENPHIVAIRQGFSKGSFAIGNGISVDGYQALDGSNQVNGTKIVLGDGRKIVSPDCFDNGPHCYKGSTGK
jgi:Family of unknown function (DUF6152)